MEGYVDLSDPLSFLGLSFVSCLTGFPPASGPNLAAGLYHGVVKGSIMFLLGAVVAAVTSTVLIRTLFKDLVLRKLAAWEPKRAALDTAIIKEGAFQITALLRLSPVMPLAPANMLLALTSVHLLPYTMGTLVGLLPFSVVYAYIGSVGQQAASGESDTTQLAIQAVGLVATIGLTWKLSKVAQSALDSASIGPIPRRNSRKNTSPTRRQAKTIDTQVAPKGARRKGTSTEAAPEVVQRQAGRSSGTSRRRASSPARSTSLTAEI